MPEKKKRRTPKRKYDRYNALFLALKKLRFTVNGEETFFASPGPVVSLLFDTFYENGGILRADEVSAKGLCGDKAGEFGRWREKMIAAGLLVYDYARAKASGDLSRHWPGELLIEYLNADIIHTFQIATTDQLYKGLAAKADKAELEKLQSEVEALKQELAEQKARVEAHRMRFATFQARGERGIKALRGMALECLGDKASDEAIEKMVDELIARYADNEKAPGEGPSRLAN